MNTLQTTALYRAYNLAFALNKVLATNNTITLSKKDAAFLINLKGFS